MVRKTLLEIPTRDVNRVPDPAEFVAAVFPTGQLSVLGMDPERSIRRVPYGARGVTLRLNKCSNGDGQFTIGRVLGESLSPARIRSAREDSP